MNIKTILLIILIIIFIFILLVLVGVGGYFFGLKTKSLSPTTIITPSPIPTQPGVGGDRDSHGCIGSAGYTWCELKQKCLRIFEEPCTAATISPTVTIAPTIDETETLKTIIKQALVAEHGSTANELTITVSKIQGDYAQGGASATGGGGAWFAAKVNGNWKLVWDGNGSIDCQDIKPYPNFPVSMIPECYDSVNQKVITR